MEVAGWWCGIGGEGGGEGRRSRGDIGDGEGGVGGGVVVVKVVVLCGEWGGIVEVVVVWHGSDGC